MHAHHGVSWQAEQGASTQERLVRITVSMYRIRLESHLGDAAEEGFQLQGCRWGLGVSCLVPVFFGKLCVEFVC